jgi:hypothetical protein
MKTFITTLLAGAIVLESVSAHARGGSGIGYTARCTYTVTAQGGTSEEFTSTGYSLSPSLKAAKRRAISRAEGKVEDKANNYAKDVCEEHGCDDNEEFVVSVNMKSGQCFADAGNPVLFKFSNINYPESLTLCVDSCVD